MITFKELIQALREAKKQDKDPCWAGYTQLGVKKKGDRVVPNCIPEKDV